MTAIEETLGFPFSGPFRPPTALAATAISLAAVVQGIREPILCNGIIRCGVYQGRCSCMLIAIKTPDPFSFLHAAATVVIYSLDASLSPPVQHVFSVASTCENRKHGLTGLTPT